MDNSKEPKYPSIPENERIAMLREGRFGFGKYFGSPFRAAPMSYLMWILRTEEEFKKNGCRVMLTAVEEVKKYIES